MQNIIEIFREKKLFLAKIFAEQAKIYTKTAISYLITVFCMTILIRPPAAAGTFYNLNQEYLKKQIESSFNHKLGPNGMKTKNVKAAVVPHAGYEYSGPVAAWAYSRMEKANYLIVGPNHTGIGSQFAIMKAGMWKTPLGDLVIASDVAEKLINTRIVEYDVLAHEHEHSVEVQLPFLQYRFGSNFKFVPIAIMNDFADDLLLDSCRLVGKAIASIIKKQKEKWVVLASTDFSHYVPQEMAEKNDRGVIKTILKLDEKDFFDKVAEKKVSMCGFGAVATVMVAAKGLGARKAELLKYATSGDVTQDLTSVVGYASIIFY